VGWAVVGALHWLYGAFNHCMLKLQVLGMEHSTVVSVFYGVDRALPYCKLVALYHSF
jgi:hypothetical protein